MCSVFVSLEKQAESLTVIPLKIPFNVSLAVFKFFFVFGFLSFTMTCLGEKEADHSQDCPKQRNHLAFSTVQEFSMPFLPEGQIT